VSGRVGDLLVLVGVVALVLLARRNGKRNRVAAIANARAAAFAEGRADALATASASNAVNVSVGQQSSAGVVGSNAEDARLAEIFRYVLAELGNDGLRAVRNGANNSAGRLGSVPDVLQLRPTTERSVPSLVANGFDVVGGPYADDSSEAMNAHHDGRGSE